MGTAQESIDEVIGESNPVGFRKRLSQMPAVHRVFAIIDRCSC